ncbi:hypothetical protein ASD54_07665 [Rhizobium sp. Root149]|uniref:hypothetical protein n=1 Tax=Rhizobium sp. Root149 TaxID=1736473 RepID=UPI0007129E43|nr:hypothetical protein [Rhizobium sp. Root149]KQZ55145.1 hypothetical protein ASD54_07665 [Rhizobium sp. Root149]
MFKDKFQWWNPFSWLEAVMQTIGGILHRIFAFFGMMSPPSTGGHENVQVADVDDAEKVAREAQEAIDAIVADMSLAQVVHAYCTASEDARKAIDLTKLSVDQQDWLLRLSDADLAMLGRSGEAACGRSVEVCKLMLNRQRLRSDEIEAAPQVLSIPGAEPTVDEMTQDEKREHLREFFADRHGELFLASGISNLDPKFTPGGATVH